jgi:hypothetical protein
VRNYIISKPHGSDSYTFKGITHDGSKPQVFQKTDSITVENVDEEKLPAPLYVNSGFTESASKITQWYQYYGGYFPASRSGSVKVLTEWLAGDIAIETEGEYAFYKCIKSHEASKIRPGKNPNFQKLTWDANGVRSDLKNWNASLSQSLFPPDDLRLEKDNYWRELGIGFQEASDLKITSERKKS